MLFHWGEILPEEDKKPHALKNECGIFARIAQKICTRSTFGLLTSPWETLFICKTQKW